MTANPFYFEFSGTSREIGIAHGKALKPVIEEAISQWSTFLEKMTGMSRDTLLSGFFEQTDYLPAIEKCAPHTLEEMRGIAEGAQLDEQLIYAWQMVDELIDYVIEYVYVEKCSTLGAYDQTPGAVPLLGKTQDLMHCYIGSAALIRTRNSDTGADLLNSTIAGIVCQDGMSPHLGLCLNHIGQLARDEQGLPVSFAGRVLLERSLNIDDAVALLEQIPHASGMNYGLVDRHASRTFEVSAKAVREFAPLPELKRLWHTNHPLSNNDYCRNIEMWNRLPDEDAGDTQRRFDYLEREISKPEAALDLARAKALLSSREAPISSQAEDSFPTINSLIIEFGEVPTLHFTPGPPSQHPYTAFTLR